MRIEDARDNLIGGPGAGNVIAFNGGNGVTVVGGLAVGNSIRGNAIIANAGLGIDLGGDGPTPNDPGDLDAGPNGLQNTPVLTATTTAATTRVVGTFDGLPNTTFTIDIYANALADPSGFQEGGRWLGSFSITTDDSGHAEFDVTLDAMTFQGETITSTATDPDGNTSEFSLVSASSQGLSLVDGIQGPDRRGYPQLGAGQRPANPRPAGPDERRTRQEPHRGRTSSRRSSTTSSRWSRRASCPPPRARP